MAYIENFALPQRTGTDRPRCAWRIRKQPWSYSVVERTSRPGQSVGGQASPARILFVDQSGELGGAELSLRDIAGHYAATASVALFADGPFVRLLTAAGVRATVLPVPPAIMDLRRDGGL